MHQPLTSPCLAGKLLVGTVCSRHHAEIIMRHLESENFDYGRISVVYPDVGAQALPGLGPFIAAGPIVAALASSTDEGSAGIDRGLSGLGIPAINAERCLERLNGGHFLLSVCTETDAEFDRARRIFAALGVEDICSPSGDQLHAA